MVLSYPEIVEAQFLALHGQLEVLVDALSQRLGRIMNRHDEHSESQWLSITHSSPSGLRNASTSTPSRSPCSRMASSALASTGIPAFWRSESVRNSSSPGTRTSSTPGAGCDDLM